MCEVIITPSDLSEDAMVELTIPTSGKDDMKITMGEFIDEEIIEDENKLLSVKLKVPDTRPYSEHCNNNPKWTSVFQRLSELRSASYISTNLEADKKMITDHIEELYKFKLKTVEILSRKNELSNLYSKIWHRYKEPRQISIKGVKREIISKRIFDYRRVRDEILQNMCSYYNIQKIEQSIKSLEEAIEIWKKELFNLELRYIKHNLESTHSEKMTLLEGNINQECQKRQKEVKEKREKEQMDREREIKARIDERERKKQEQYNDWKKREDEIMAPDFKIQSREHIRMLGSDISIGGYTFGDFKYGSEDFKYSDEFKKYLRENIDKHSKGKKEYEEYKLKAEMMPVRPGSGGFTQPKCTFDSYREKDNTIKDTERQLNYHSKYLHILNAVKTFYDEEEKIQKEKEKQEKKIMMELQKQEKHINKLKEEKKQVCINGNMFKRKRNETFEEFVYRINLKTPVSINKILGLEEGTLLDDEEILIESILESVSDSIFVPLDFMTRGGGGGVVL